MTSWLKNNESQSQAAITAKTSLAPSMVTRHVPEPAQPSNGWLEGPTIANDDVKTDTEMNSLKLLQMKSKLKTPMKKISCKMQLQRLEKEMKAP